MDQLDQTRDEEIPPGNYIVKVVEDLGSKYRVEIVDGEHRGKRFIMQKTFAERFAMGHLNFDT